MVISLLLDFLSMLRPRKRKLPPPSKLRSISPVRFTFRCRAKWSWTATANTLLGANTSRSSTYATTCTHAFPCPLTETSPEKTVVSIKDGLIPNSCSKWLKCSTQAKPLVLKPFMALNASRNIGLPSGNCIVFGGIFRMTLMGLPRRRPRGEAMNAALMSRPRITRSRTAASAMRILKDSMLEVGEETMRSRAELFPFAISRATSRMRTFKGSFSTQTHRQVIILICHCLARRWASCSWIGLPTFWLVMESISVRIPAYARSLSRYWPLASLMTYPGNKSKISSPQRFALLLLGFTPRIW